MAQVKTAKNAGSTPKKRQVNPFHQRLASLTVHQATELLGPDGRQLMMAGSKVHLKSEDDVFLGGDLYRFRMEDHETGEKVVVTVTMVSGRDHRLQVNCDHCDSACAHAGAALTHLLEVKSFLGLAAPPDESVPLELLTESELVQRALAERQKRAEEEPMQIRSSNKETPWTDYVVTSHHSGRTYRVALRGTERGQSYCGCPDFRTNHLGTCKHIMRVLAKAKKAFKSGQLATPYKRKNLSVRVDYGDNHGFLFNVPARLTPKIAELIGDSASVSVDALTIMNKIQAIAQAGLDVHVYPDAEELIQRALLQERLRKYCEEIRQDTTNHPLRKELLKAELLPYQLDGIAFVVGAGRAVLADDMGLGKTIQAIGIAELLAREAEIRRVLVVCPASLKAQWQSEIARFCGRTSQMVFGSGKDRAEQYRADVFFTICNYEQVMRDLPAIEAASWDLIILDEGQRIKNYLSKTSQSIRSLRSTFALVLSGTPLENRLDDLYTVVQFVDDRRLGPAYRFFHQFRTVGANARGTGYKNLDRLRELLRPILLRRKRGEVSKQLPDRLDQVVRIAPTAEQFEMSNGQLSVAAQIAAKKYLTEMDMIRLQKALMMARMAADSTYLVDKQEPEYSTKLERLVELLEELIAAPDRKIVLFSEWRTMLDRIEKRINPMGFDFVRLDGQVPQKKRPSIVHRFQTDPDCRMIMMTNAGSTGLNLQSANTVINVDLPWNPAVLEQRIARAHRMGQKNPVHIYKLVTDHTIEENLLDTLASKQDLADAALDFESDVSELTMRSSITSIRERLEKILRPTTAPIDVSQQQAVIAQVESLEQRRERVSLAGGELLGAALQLVGELVGRQTAAPPNEQAVQQLTSSLAECVQRDASGRPQLTISLADDGALRGLAETLARLLLPKSP